MKKKKQINRVDKFLEIPKEIYSDDPKIVVTGFDELIIENFKGILEYEEFFVRINTYIGVINVNLDGVLKSGEEDFRIMLNPTPQSQRPFMQNFIQDAYIATNRIPHHRIILGNTRPAVGYEGSQSPYTLPFINRSQISRNFGTVRKFGLRVVGNYDFIDYDLGALSSDTFFS